MTELKSPAFPGPVAGPSRWKIPDEFVPKSIVCLREGYGRRFFFDDLGAGVTVAIIALPLSLALAIGSGVRPEQGLFTAIVAGFLISLLGGSRVQVGGPAGAFMAIVAGIVARDGYDGMCIATLMAGAILIFMGLSRLGSLIKFIPYPVTTGFTSGIAVIIFTSQIRDLLGLSINYINAQGQLVHVPPSKFLPCWHVLLQSAHTINWLATGFGIGSLLLLALLRRFVPRVPGAIVVVIISVGLVSMFHLAATPQTHSGIETLGTRFGAISNRLPKPRLPVKLSSWADVSAAWAKAQNLVPEAVTIALLCSVESLLCAVVADGMIGGRHKSNCELIAQGTANIASIIFGGIPATGVIARTAANVKCGGRTPLSGIVHSATLLVLMMLVAPYAGRIPLAALAAILVVVAWNMAEIDHFKSILRAPRADTLVLLTTFGLTVLTDLTKGVGIGMILAAILFMKRMTEVTNVGAMRTELDETGDEFAELADPNSMTRRDVPRGVEVYEINGPFFFGVADRLKDTLKSLERPPKVFILRMRRVPAIDATGMHALDEFHDKCRKQGTQLLISGVHAQPVFALTQYGLVDKIGEQNLFGSIDEALNRARQIVGQQPQTPPPTAVPEVARARQ
ncbi:MAG TPA: sulfate permease [Tepidisphaeraceae bacterium]|nr:sulfate permease [Tepidisphaeraceae bacterium]